jgi:inosose dehydratase
MDFLKKTNMMKSQMTETERGYTRRTFCRTVALGLGAAMLATPGSQGAETPKRRLKIGHTGITWGYKPENAAQAIKDVGSLGYYGYETFGEYFAYWEAKGGLEPLLEQAKIKLKSAYCNVTLTNSDAAKRKSEVDKIVGWGKILKRCGGTVAVIGPNGVNRGQYDINVHKADIVATLNDMGMALSDLGLTTALHPHTGTCIEKHDEIYAVLEAVDTKYVKFGPDVGQIAKGGSDPVEIVKHFLELIDHVHLKDWDGGPNWSAYCPLGTGKVAIPAILDLLEKSNIKEMIMVELDSGGSNAPMTPIETVKIAKAYLQNQGYMFQS